MGVDGSVYDFGESGTMDGIIRGAIGLTIVFVGSIVLGFGFTFLGKDVTDEIAVEGVIGLTTSLEGSGILDFDCTFLGKGEEGIYDVEGKVDGGRGRVSHGDNRGVVKVFERGEVEGIG